jgi:hypothetical protein
MKLLPIFLIIFWIILIKFPEFLSLILWWLFIFLGLNGLMILWLFNKMKKNSGKPNGDDYVQFWKYKIFK